MRKINFFDGAASGTVPTIGNIVATDLVQYANDASFEANNQGSPTTGNIYYNTSSNLIRYYNGTSWVSILDESATQVVQNKTIDGTDATGTNTVSIDATDATYDNTSSGLTATNAQTAIDEVEGRVDTNETNISTNTSNISTNSTKIGNLESLSGEPSGSTTHADFSGTTIPASSTTRGAIQALETAFEGLGNAMEYKGTFDPTGPTPNLQNGTGGIGDFYRVSVAGSHDFGAGSVTLAIGDSVIYNGTTWDKYDEQTLSDTDALPEGSTNLYYTEGRVTANASVTANTAKVSADGSINTHSDVDTTTTTPSTNDVLTWTGSEWEPAAVTASDVSIVKQVYTAGTTWNKPANLVGVMVEVVGGGGAGGGAATTVAGQIAGGVGGGAGGYCKKYILAASLGSTETVTVGSGGAGASGAAGAAGGNSSFGAHCSANGGSGGSVSGVVTSTQTVTGVNGGTATGGDLNVTGGGSKSAYFSVSIYSEGTGGGSNPLGTGGKGVIRNITADGGYSGGGYGAGGGAYANWANRAAAAGANGTTGVVIVTEYIQG